MAGKYMTERVIDTVASMKEWALKYASMGLAVFPIKEREKAPATPHGCKDATTDTLQIETWWSINPQYNIGIATGSRSGGLVVIDLDIDEEKGKNGYATLKEWQKEHGDLPETWISITGSGGYHYFYRDTAANKNKVALYDGVDIRGEGGYIVAPPSIHPNGHTYEWEQEPGEYEIVQVNNLAAEFLLGPAPEKKQSFHMPDTIPEGKRVSSLVSLIGSLKANGMLDESIRDAVHRENTIRCIPPLTDQELERQVFPTLKRGWMPERPYTATADKGKMKALEKKNIPEVKSISAAELYKMEIPPIEWLVKKMLPVGLSMIGAPSKYYKSYMALGLCLAICKGGKFLNFDCNKHGCLYLDLESTKRRPKTRLSQILGFEEWPDNFHLLTSENNVQKLGEGFEEQIEQQLREYPDIKLVVVDVFQIIRKAAKRNQSGYDRDYDDLSILKKIADSHNIGLMLIHHTRKMKDPSDIFNDLSGSMGTLGSLDCAWVISKEDRFSAEATIHVTGRDMEGQKFKIRFNKNTFKWEYIGTVEDVEYQRRVFTYQQSPIRETIVKLVAQGSGQWEGSAEDIKMASKYLSWEIYDDVRKIGKFIREYDDLFQGIDGINPVPGSTKTRKWKFNATNANNDTNATNAT